MDAPTAPVKKLTAIAAPAKPVSEMTEAELDAFADRVFEGIADSVGHRTVRAAER